MKLLFIHQNFPSQYLHLAAYYAANPANQVTALGEGANLQGNTMIPGVRLIGYKAPEPANPETYFMAGSFEGAARRAMQAAGALKALKESGFEPDVILLHPDWGDGMFLKVYYPNTPMLAYAEYYNSAWSADLDFSPCSAPPEGLRCLMEATNGVRAISFAAADHLSSPYHFQRNLLPETLRRRTSLLHDGIDTDFLRPNPAASLTLPPDEELFDRNNPPLPAYVPRRRTPLTLSAKDEVFTFGTRTLEPYRGWNSFARALPHIQRKRPNAHCVIVGRSWGYYGPAPDGGYGGGSGGEALNWRDVFLDSLKDELDFSRIHFTGSLAYGEMISLLALSRAHVYMTYPFILSYSPIEAMSCETPLVLSSTAPLLEVAKHEENALLVDFHDPQELAESVCRLLADSSLRARLGRVAREFVINNYDLKRICLPRWDSVIQSLARGEQVEPLL